MYQKTCDKCGEVLPDATWQTPAILCEDCRRKLLGIIRRPRTDRDFPYDWSFDDKIDKANEMGMSDGKFVALVHCGMIDAAALDKPKPVRFAGRRGRRRA